MTNILVVDDSAVDRRLVEGLLSHEPDWLISQAENGALAMSAMRQSMPDLVLTDLIMPEMDGMQLVTRMKEEGIDIPVIIITGKGSEWMAVKALQRGAASYVPKSKLNEVLIETIKQVLEMVEFDRSYQRLIAGLQETAYRFRIESDPYLIPPLVNLFQQLAYSMRLCGRTGRNRLGVALDEALLNAIYHGNLELPRVLLPEVRAALRRGDDVDLVQQRLAEAPYRQRNVFVEAVLTRSQVQIRIRDEGSGFRPELAPEPGDATILENDGGRGLVLIKNFMDQVSFNENGTEILMIKNCEESK